MDKEFYPKEMYRNNHYRVVHSGEEQRKMEGLGWSLEADRDRYGYVVHTSGIPEEGQPEQKRGPGRPPKEK